MRFRDVDSAGRAFAHLTPTYLHRLLRDRMTYAPRPFEYPVPLPGDEVAVNLYGVRLPPEIAREVQLSGQMTAIRAGHVVLLIESIGLPPEQLVPTVESLVNAAKSQRADGKRQ